jgi:GAF domain-containing protein
MSAEIPGGLSGLDLGCEAARLEAIAALGLLDGTPVPELDALVRDVSERLGVTSAAVSLILDGAQYFVAMHGLGGWVGKARGTPREWAFCDRVVRTQAAFEVRDATVDPHVDHNPLATFDGVRCYLGVPLRTRDGHVIGTLCGLDTVAREFSDADRAAIRALADQAMAALEARVSRT